MTEQYIVLICTAEGRSIWKAGEDPDLLAVAPDISNAPRKIIGPVLVGEGGYESVEEANDTGALEVDLWNPATWWEAE